MNAPANLGHVRVGTLDELKDKRCIVVRGAQHPIAVYCHDGKLHAVDNRCPHMGFPLSKGSVKDGILTCHWHHARFDLSSGCAFDLFADDVPTAPIEVRDGQVWVGSQCQVADEEAHWPRRLIEGMEQNLPLIIAKAILHMLDRGQATKIVRSAAMFGTRYRVGWASGMTILTVTGNLLEHLPVEQQYLALYHGVSRVAADCAGQTPRRDRYPLEQSDVSFDTLKRWFRDWVRVRHRDGAERTLLTAIQRGATQAQLADMLLSAETDRFYSGGGHSLDFINKSFELLDLIGWEHAAEILPTVVPQLAAARGGEESSAWRHPIDLVPLLNGAFEQFPSLLREGAACPKWTGEAELADAMLCDSPESIVEAINVAIRHGARAEQLSKSLCYAAALRVARFGTANEFSDWFTALHTFTYCNALDQSVRRLGSAAGPDVLRGIYHGAMSVYLDRFLNVPPAHLPGERDRAALDEESRDAEALREKYLDLHNTQQRVNASARVLARYLSLGHDLPPMIATLAQGVLREDADFHTFQMLEAALRQHGQWSKSSDEARNTLIALARYSSAFAPTQRRSLQTAEIAMKLHRGAAVYEEE